MLRMVFASLRFLSTSFYLKLVAALLTEPMYSLTFNSVTVYYHFGWCFQTRFMHHSTDMISP